MRIRLSSTAVLLALAIVLGAVGLPRIPLRFESAAGTSADIDRENRDEGDETGSAGAPAREPTRSRPPAAERIAGRPLHASNEAPASEPAPARIPARDPGPEDTGRRERRLAGADRDEIRRVLDRAIESERETRPLRVDPSVLQTAASAGEVRVVFALDPAAPLAIEGLEQLRVFPRFEHAAARLDPDALLTLIESGQTDSIEIDALHRPSLLESLPIIGADVAHESGVDGDAFVIAVLDTGVEASHPLFGGRVVEEACFSTPGQCPNGSTSMFGPGAAAPCAHSACGHGTHVAGIAIAEDPDGPLAGVAPHANLIAIQIFSEVDGDLGAYSSDILAGLQHVLGLAPFYDIAVVNLSFGADPFTSEADCDAASASQSGAVAQLRSAGIATVAAAGNERLTNAITTPACLSNVLGIGSTSDVDAVSSFSNSASFLALLAPGQSIESAAAGGTTRYASGTSMATPHVAGAIAALREAYPAARVGEIENALRLSGQAVFDDRNGETFPRIDIVAALDVLANAAAPPEEPDPPASGATGGDASGPATASTGGGGGGCGLVGLEPFLILGIVRLGRRRRRTRPAATAGNAARAARAAKT